MEAVVEVLNALVVMVSSLGMFIWIFASSLIQFILSAVYGLTNLISLLPNMLPSTILPYVAVYLGLSFLVRVL